MLENALRLKPDYAKAELHRGRCYKALRRDEAALQCAQRAVELDPLLKDAAVLFGLIPEGAFDAHRFNRDLFSQHDDFLSRVSDMAPKFQAAQDELFEQSGSSRRQRTPLEELLGPRAVDLPTRFEQILPDRDLAETTKEIERSIDAITPPPSPLNLRGEDRPRAVVVGCLNPYVRAVVIATGEISEPYYVKITDSISSERKSDQHRRMIRTGWVHPRLPFMASLDDDWVLASGTLLSPGGLASKLVEVFVEHLQIDPADVTINVTT